MVAKKPPTSRKRSVPKSKYAKRQKIRERKRQRKNDVTPPSSSLTKPISKGPSFQTKPITKGPSSQTKPVSKGPTKKPTKKPINKTESKELKRHLFIFKALTKQAKNRDIVLNKAPLTLYKTIRLLFKLMKKGAIPLNNAQRDRLKPWVSFIRNNSVGKDSSIRSRVVQNGNGLSSILKTILPIIAPILSMII